MYKLKTFKKKKKLEKSNTYFRRTSAASAHDANAFTYNLCRYKYPPW